MFIKTYNVSDTNVDAFNDDVIESLSQAAGYISKNWWNLVWF